MLPVHQFYTSDSFTRYGHSQTYGFALPPIRLLYPTVVGLLRHCNADSRISRFLYLLCVFLWLFNGFSRRLFADGHWAGCSQVSLPPATRSRPEDFSFLSDVVYIRRFWCTMMYILARLLPCIHAVVLAVLQKACGIHLKFTEWWHLIALAMLVGKCRVADRCSGVQASSQNLAANLLHKPTYKKI